MFRLFVGLAGLSTCVVAVPLPCAGSDRLTDAELNSAVGGVTPNCMGSEPQSGPSHCAICEDIEGGSSWRCSGDPSDNVCTTYHIPYPHSGPECKQNFDDCDGDLIVYNDSGCLGDSSLFGACDRTYANDYVLGTSYPAYCP